MESPKSWDLLTASLAVTDLHRASSVWAFLVVQGLVRDNPGDLDTFTKIVHDEIARGAVTGPSIASRIAGGVEKAGIALPASSISDPKGVIATKRLHIILEWGGNLLGQQQAKYLEQLRMRSQQTKRWWEFWK